MSKRKESIFLPLFLSALLHAVVFAALSLEFLWPVTVSARKPISVRILPEALPKPKEAVRPNPESRLLSDANRRESGKGPKKAGKPRLRREEEEKLSARRGAPKAERPPKIAALPPPPAPKPAPPAPKAVRPAPKPKVQKPVPKKPAEPKKEVVKKPVKAVEKKPAAKKIKSVGKKPAPVPKKKPVREKAVQKKKEPPKKKPEKKKIAKKEKIKLAALPPRPKPAPARVRPRPPAPKAPQSDPLALFRSRPRGSGQPRAPRLNLTDEEAERIAKAARERDLKKEKEEGDVVSLDTRNFKYVSYFAHIKRKIQAAWSWPQEARNFGGRLTLKFVLRSDGTLSRVELLNSSGYRILDDEAIAAVTKAAPFRPFPPGFGRKILPIEGNFIYERRQRGIGG